MYIMCLSKGLGAVQRAIDEGLLPSKIIGFVPTANETYDAPTFTEESRTQLKKLGLSLIDLDVSNDTLEDLILKTSRVDGVYIAGGNTFHLSQQMKKYGFEQYLINKVKEGMPYFGESAGAIYLYPNLEAAKTIDKIEDVPGLTDFNGLGLVDFFTLPHVNIEKYKDQYEKFMAENEDELKIVRIKDDQALLTRDGSSYVVLQSSMAEAPGASN